MADEPKGQPVVLFITSCTVAHSTDSYTIYEVQAKREDGTPVADKALRSFEDLPLGERLELTAKRFDSERHGTSWTLARKHKPPGSQERINELQERLVGLEQRVARLEGAGAQAAQTQALDERFGQDAPY